MHKPRILQLPRESKQFQLSIRTERIKTQPDSLLSQRSLITLPIIKIGSGENPLLKRNSSKDSYKSSQSINSRNSSVKYIIKQSKSKTRKQSDTPQMTSFKWSDAGSQSNSTATTISHLKRHLASFRQASTTSASTANTLQLQKMKASPTKISSFNREKTSIIIPPKEKFNQEKKLTPTRSDSATTSPTRTNMKRRESESAIRSKQDSVSSMITGSEEHSVWDNRDLVYRGVFVHNMNETEQVQSFLKLFKMRFGQFPGQQESISNEDVIKYAITYAKVNKKMFRKYFPTNQVIFEDDVDYSKDHDLQQDPNFQKFLDFVKKNQQPLFQAVEENKEEENRDDEVDMPFPQKSLLRLSSANKRRNQREHFETRPREKTMS